ncbi:MAG: hypothetical protein Rubg2KO_21640 [Rubricoccaceae bacterium]
MQASSTEWTILRPVGLTDTRAAGNALVSSTGAFRGNTIPRHDVAEVIAQLLETNGAVGETLTLSA